MWLIIHNQFLGTKSHQRNLRPSGSLRGVRWVVTYQKILDGHFFMRRATWSYRIIQNSLHSMDNNEKSPRNVRESVTSLPPPPLTVQLTVQRPKQHKHSHSPNKAFSILEQKFILPHRWLRWSTLVEILSCCRFHRGPRRCFYHLRFWLCVYETLRKQKYHRESKLRFQPKFVITGILWHFKESFL